MNRAALARARLSQGTYGSQGERYTWSYWSTAFLASATMFHRLFTNAIGSEVSGIMQNYQHTNITQQGMPQGHKFIVKKLGVQLYNGTALAAEQNKTVADTVASIRKMLHTTILNVEITGKASIGQWALDELAGDLVGPALPEAATALVHPDMAKISTGWYRLKIPLVFAALTGYSFNLQHYSAVDSVLSLETPVELKVIMAGELRRLS